MSYDGEIQESFSEEADHELMHDTDQDQSAVQLEDVRGSHIHERKWKDSIAIEFSH